MLIFNPLFIDQPYTSHELPPLVTSCTLFPTTCWAMIFCELTLAIHKPPQVKRRCSKRSRPTMKHTSWSRWRLPVSYVIMTFIVGVSTPGGSLDRRVNCRCVSQPRWVGARRNTRGKTVRGNCGLVLSCVQGGCACSRGLQAFAWERERARALRVGPFSHAATFSYEGPGPSFYICKEKAQVYNGGCSNVLTCLAERSQSPKYMPTWLLERCCCPVHVMSWPSEERLSPIVA
jgi:hypothetical protein